MLKRLFQRSAPVAQTLSRESRVQKASRWASVMPPLGRKVRVTRVERETADAVSVFLEPMDGGAMSWKAGQYLTHCFDVDGQNLRRAYSLSLAQGSRELAYTCKAVDDGRVSAYVNTTLKVGDEYEVRGPSGDFCLVETAAPLVFVAAGSGITPIISLLETALQALPDRPVHLIYASRDQAQIIFAQRLEKLAQQHPGLTVSLVLSQAGSDWEGERGRLDADRVRALLPPACIQQSHWYLCGPAAFMDAVAPGLLDAGVSEDRLHRENFRSVNHAAAAHPVSAQEIRFVRSGVSATQQPGQSILDTAMAHGVALDFSCTVGGCAACKVKVPRGKFTMDEPNCLSDEERAQGYTLACSAYALEAIEVEA